MKFKAKALVATFILVAGVAVAADATDPTVKAWQELMDGNGAATKTLGGMAGDKMPFDAAAAAEAKAALIAHSGDIAAKFKTQATDPASKASPDIWTNWDDFVAKANALSTAAAALDVASLETLKAGMGAVGGACKDCHTKYNLP
ncbi:MAG: cytochrome c [Rhodobacteraceae bacterium]|nr:cytochrome c [Paracoccaceae bacterium]